MVQNRNQNQNKCFLAIINLFVANGININHKNEYGDNALTILCRWYRTENLIDVIRLLIKNGIDINCKNIYGANALTELCPNSNNNENLIDVIKLLIKSGINLTDQNCYYFQTVYKGKHRDEILQLLRV